MTTYTLLITPTEVVEAVFASAPNIADQIVDRSMILVAQQKFILPLMGARMVTALEEGLYPQLLDQYVKPALAMCVKLLALPALNAQIGASGIVTFNGESFASADHSPYHELEQSVASSARTLLRRLDERLRRTPDEFAHYSARENSRPFSVAAGLIL